MCYENAYSAMIYEICIYLEKSACYDCYGAMICSKTSLIFVLLILYFYRSFINILLVQLRYFVLFAVSLAVFEARLGLQKSLQLNFLLFVYLFGCSSFIAEC